MLNCQNITVTYGKTHTVLRGISFCAKAGEITAVLGANGSGKSTLLRAVMHEIPYKGTVTLNGCDLSKTPPAGRALQISMLPQHLPAPALTVWETVALGRTPHTTHLGELDRTVIENALAKCEITHLRDRRTDLLSGGERQKVFLALLLAQDTPVLLLDEPTTYMDLSFTARFFRILQEERDRGKAILLVMHDLTDAFAVADSLVILKDGSVAFFGSPADALAQDLPERIFGVQQYTAQRGEKTAYFFR